MTRQRCVSLSILALTTGLLAGCMPKITMEDMKNMKPEHPPELAKLEMFLGDWEGTSNWKLAGMEEEMEGKGNSKMEWSLDGMFLVEHGVYEMGEVGTMKGVGVWTYDPKAKKYRMWWFDSYGGTGNGTAKYSDEDKTWNMKVKGQSPMGKTKGKGTLVFVDDNTMEWTWKEWDRTGLFKIMEACGTQKRKQ